MRRKLSELQRGLLHYFSSRSINGKLTLLTVTASGVTLLVACLAFVTNDITVIRNSKVTQLTALAEVLASNSTAALSFGRSSVAEELLESLKNRPTIKYACLLDDNGELFAQYSSDPDVKRPQPKLINQQMGYHFTDDGYLEVVLTVEEDGDKLGKICLYESLSDLNAQFIRYAVIVAMVVVLSLLVAVLCSFRLQRSISAPILELATTAKRISNEGDYSLRVLRPSDDEIGTLYEQFNLMLEQIQQGEQSLQDARNKLEIRVQERTAELEEMHKQLLDTARRAGMAEVATSVLHNVGNILNSVNVSADLIKERLRKSELKDLNRALVILEEHKNDLATFVTESPKGKHLAPYLIAAGRTLQSEQNELTELCASLVENIDHIKTIVSMQQSYTKVSGLAETLSLADMVDDVIEMHANSLEKRGIKLVKQYDNIPDVTVDKHRLVQILVNLIKNAKEALFEKKGDGATLTVRLEKNGADRIRIVVEDNGIGICPQHLEKIFTYGFTTKDAGHGYGLHSCANLAGELGGSLSTHSEGLNKGAAFIIDLPINTTKATAVSSV
ncbi:MAG: HAMP domain-containing protein [Pirellulales bacterium]|nr:HAMP domain-containing protein [Pirellulales bacterium]